MHEGEMAEKFASLWAGQARPRGMHTTCMAPPHACRSARSPMLHARAHACFLPVAPMHACHPMADSPDLRIEVGPWERGLPREEIAVPGEALKEAMRAVRGG